MKHDQPVSAAVVDSLISHPVIKFLLGEGDLFGKWWGEKAAVDKPYWWREHLRAAIVAFSGCNGLISDAPVTTAAVVEPAGLSTLDDALQGIRMHIESIRGHYENRLQLRGKLLTEVFNDINLPAKLRRKISAALGFGIPSATPEAIRPDEWECTNCECDNPSKFNECGNCGQRRAPSTAASAGEADYSVAWLIERYPHNSILYLALNDLGEVMWSANVNEAMRFSRRVDAEKFGIGSEDAHFVEHAWGFRPAAPVMPDDRIKCKHGYRKPGEECWTCDHEGDTK